MKILNFKDRAHHLMTLATWHHAEWSYLNPERSFDERVQEMREELEGKPIPATFVAEDEAGNLLGSASLLAQDMSSHPELTPWLASVYVNPDYRGNGIGSALVRHVMQHAGDIGVQRMYLYTPDQEQLYARLGWERVSCEPYNGTPVTIMQFHPPGGVLSPEA